MEQKNSMKIIKELQDDIATMRKDGPQYYTQILNKEFTAMRNNFAQADFKGIEGYQVVTKPINQTYIDINLQENVTPNEKLIQLNARSDDLLECMSYMNE